MKSNILDRRRANISSAVLTKHFDARLRKLEEGNEANWFKKITQNASASALFLGLVLSCASVYDVFVTKPEADRVSNISQFNQAVNAAAKLRQDFILLQIQSKDPALVFAIGNAITPQILSNISTARALMRDLPEEDIGVPQLLILIYESFTEDDRYSAKKFIDLAVRKVDATPMEKVEAKRYEARYYATIRDLQNMRLSYGDAVKLSSLDPMKTAIVLQDWAVYEFYVGDCQIGLDKVDDLLKVFSSPNFSPVAASQIAASLRAQLLQLPAARCPALNGISSLLPG